VLVVVGGSAGGIEALGTIVKTLPHQMPIPVLVVNHVPPRFPSHLPQILGRTTALDVAHAIDGERIKRGTIRIAPPDHHLVVHDGRLNLTRTPKENRHRPSIDVLFRSAARWYGARVVAVVLSGGPGDGADGVRAVSRGGGQVLVQEPADAMFSALPESALEVARPQYMGSAEELGRVLSNLANLAPSERKRGTLEVTRSMSEEEPTNGEGWRPSVFACPDCTGVLWERDDGELIRFRCRIGHFYGPEALVDGKSEELESALWSAINTMEERGELAQRLSRRADQIGLEETSGRYSETAENMRRQAQQIRDLLATWEDPRLEGVASPADDRADEVPA
jgi:two-component system chemotaxis response regulator CheB